VDSGRELLVDSHVHFWDRARLEYPWLETEDSVLRRDYLPDHLREDVAEIDEVNISGYVFVQADCRPEQSARETAWVHELARAGAPILAIVAHASLERGPACADELDQLALSPLVSGVRRLIQDEPVEFVCDPGFVDGVRRLSAHGFVMDLCIRHHQLDEIARLVGRCPEVLFVLDHLAKPVVASGEFGAWAAALARVAAYPNVRCKLSGLATQAPPQLRSLDGLRPWLDHALDVFGPGRCMFGSDWPVVRAATSYRQWCEIFLDVASGLEPDDRSSVLSATALDAYDPLRRAARAKDS
jgi:predicted TIM-barrel fold metal-dependent hydrolase